MKRRDEFGLSQMVRDAVIRGEKFPPQHKDAVSVYRKQLFAEFRAFVPSLCKLLFGNNLNIWVIAGRCLYFFLTLWASLLYVVR